MHIHKALSKYLFDSLPHILSKMECEGGQETGLSERTLFLILYNNFLYDKGAWFKSLILF